MDIDLLKTFIAAVETGSFSRAAAQVCRTPAAISMQMKRLEEQSKRQLFHRHSRHLELTREGKQLVGYARRILTLHDEAMAQVQSVQDIPVLRLGCPEDYAGHLLPQLLLDLRNAVSDLTFEVTTAPTVRLRQQLDDGELDLAVLTQQPGDEEGYPLYHDHGIWLVPENLSLGMDTLPLALYDTDCKFNTSALDILEKLERHYQLLCISPSVTLLTELVRRGEAISVMASSSVPASMKSLIASEETLPSLPKIAIALTAGANPHPHVSRTLIRQIADQFQQ